MSPQLSSSTHKSEEGSFWGGVPHKESVRHLRHFRRMNEVQGEALAKEVSRGRTLKALRGAVRPSCLAQLTSAAPDTRSSLAGSALSRSFQATAVATKAADVSQRKHGNYLSTFNVFGAMGPCVRDFALTFKTVVLPAPEEASPAYVLAAFLHNI